jgi:hypothetical protein
MNISLNQSIFWGIKQFFKHWQLALAMITLRLAIFCIFRYAFPAQPLPEFTSPEQITQLAGGALGLLSLMKSFALLIINIIAIPCALAIYQRGAASFKDVLAGLPVILRYLLFIVLFIFIFSIASLCFTSAYYIHSMTNTFDFGSFFFGPIIYLAAKCAIPLLCFAGLYLVGRYYLAFCVLFGEKIGFIASLKRTVQLSRNNWITIALVGAFELLFIESPFHFIAILTAVHAYGTLRGTTPHDQVTVNAA